MVDSEKCPRCGKKLVVNGSIFKRNGFRPEGLKFFSLTFQWPEVPVPNQHAACAACGLVWSELDPAALRQKLRDLGNEEVKQHLGIDDAK
jgi:hypothetical protein